MPSPLFPAAHSCSAGLFLCPRARLLSHAQVPPWYVDEGLEPFLSGPQEKLKPSTKPRLALKTKQATITCPKPCSMSAEELPPPAPPAKSLTILFQPRAIPALPQVSCTSCPSHLLPGDLVPTDTTSLLQQGVPPKVALKPPASRR
ncbi:UNVERIFIED_CONTAM: hypothetical protein H355_008625 [Colinus virginianus]|nr:hypothetical protein H355_008625 [Colinus virginianus]